MHWYKKGSDKLFQQPFVWVLYILSEPISLLIQLLLCLAELSTVHDPIAPAGSYCTPNYIADLFPTIRTRNKSRMKLNTLIDFEVE